MNTETKNSLAVPAARKEHPVAITATWDSARGWLEGAKRMEQGKLFCQVMFGFTIQALHKEHGIKCGPKSGNLSHDGKDSWEEVLLKETGLAQTTAYRYIEMAKAALPRLRKLPGLRAFDPTAMPINALPEPQQKALSDAVAKITNGQTQKEFGESLGLWKKPQGAGASGGKGGNRKKLSLEEQAEALKALAEEDWKNLDQSLAAYGAMFTALNDEAVTAQISRLEQALALRKAWLKQPKNHRNPKQIEQLEVASH